MNISSGGPHILLFERDQQLTTLLSSELQLAGYECHAARTAVEVFDAIARYPVRLVLVNLAQAAASRREFWVALDTQRRGKGVQVFTFNCVNLAGYGPPSPLDDSEDRSHTALADMEVDGMMGMMNLVNAVRSRVPGQTTTGSFSRVTSQAPASTSAPGQATVSMSPLTTQPTGPLPMMLTNGTSAPIGQNPAPVNMNVPPKPYAPPPTPPVQPQPSMIVSPVVNPPTPIPSTPGMPTGLSGPTPSPSYTDKIRAVIYPGQRSWPEARPNNGRESVPAQSEQVNRNGSPQPQIQPVQDAYRSPMGSPLQNPSQAYNPPPVNVNQALNASESSLDQLSRMLMDQGIQNRDNQAEAAPRQITNRENGIQQQQVQQVQQVRPTDTSSLRDLSLRASPIQDLPMERSNYTSNAVPPTPTPQVQREIPETRKYTNERTLQSDDTFHGIPASNQHRSMQERVDEQKSPTSTLSGEISQEGRTLIEQVQATLQSTLPQRSEVEKKVGADNALLLNIMQSLPPMPPATPQPREQSQVLNGRATRSLGSVLLEGHLVPQNRLEVAQHIQRMLRGVDMNYQLGEILLMFKLLTHDQLLAASLVSYGLINPAQISALGRIRQELHSIGLEYDLESLLMLFRILTPEQLRELRSSWAG